MSARAPDPDLAASISFPGNKVEWAFEMGYMARWLRWAATLSLALALLPSVCNAQVCDKSLWRHIYHKPRLVVQRACVSVTGTIVDASHGKNKDGARHEADGDGHLWLKLDPSQDKYLNAENKAKQEGNLVFEPVCRYKVTQADAKAVCKDYHQPLVVPAVGKHVKMTGAWVLDKQHGHMEIHPVSAIEVLP